MLTIFRTITLHKYSLISMTKFLLQYYYQKTSDSPGEHQQCALSRGDPLCWRADFGQPTIGDKLRSGDILSVRTANSTLLYVTSVPRIPHSRRAINEHQVNVGSLRDLLLLVHVGWSVQASSFPRICWARFYFKQLLVSTLVSPLACNLLEEI